MSETMDTLNAKADALIAANTRLTASNQALINLTRGIKSTLDGLTASGVVLPGQLDGLGAKLQTAIDSAVAVAAADDAEVAADTPAPTPAPAPAAATPETPASPAAPTSDPTTPA